MNKSEFKEGQEVWAKFKVANPDIDSVGEIKIVNESGWETWLKPEEIMTEIPEKQELPEIPQYVAEWIEKTKRTYDLYWAMSQIIGNFAPPKVIEWFYTNTTLKGEILARAWLDGYEIEQEKLYTVEIPNPNCDGLTTLERANNDYIVLTQMDNFYNKWYERTEYRLTEEEIRKDFEWAWRWAEPVPMEVE